MPRRNKKQRKSKNDDVARALPPVLPDDSDDDVQPNYSDVPPNYSAVAQAGDSSDSDDDVGDSASMYAFVELREDSRSPVLLADEATPVRLVSACLGADARQDARMVLRVRIYGDKKFQTLGVLFYGPGGGENLTFPLDMIFSKPIEFQVVGGESTVHLTLRFLSSLETSYVSEDDGSEEPFFADDDDDDDMLREATENARLNASMRHELPDSDSENDDDFNGDFNDEESSSGEDSETYVDGVRMNASDYPDEVDSEDSSEDLDVKKEGLEIQQLESSSSEESSSEFDFSRVIEEAVDVEQAKKDIEWLANNLQDQKLTVNLMTTKLKTRYANRPFKRAVSKFYNHGIQRFIKTHVPSLKVVNNVVSFAE